MTSRKEKKIFSVWLLAVSLLFISGQMAVAEKNSQDNNKITINFQDVDISTVISSVSRITGRVFIIDPRVKGKVTILASQEVAESELYPIFLSILQVHEFAAIEDGGVVKIVPLARVKHDSSALDFDGATDKDRPADSMVTRLVKLKHVQAEKLVAILRPLVESKSYLAAQADSNMLIISDRSANIERLLKIIDQVDQPRSGDIEVIKLEHADARDLVQIIEGLENGRQKGGDIQDVRLISDTRTNSILLSGAEYKVLKIKTLISYLDTPVESDGTTQVVFLRYAKAKDLLPILQGGDFAKTGERKGPKGAAPAPGANVVELNVQADESTNALIVTAPPAIAKNLMSVIRQLDIRRPQVMIEAVIAEVATGAGAELGVQWRATDVTSGNDTGVVGGTSFSGPSVPNINVLSSGTSAALGAMAAMSGFNLGYLNGSSNILGASLNLGALVSALASDGDTNILSTPSLVTMDNEEAQIVVGKNVPISTGSYTSTGNNNPTNPFTTYTRQDVGLKLKVLPQINEGDTIRLDIEQEVSNLVPDSKSTVGLQETSTRQIKTSVMVDDGKILVLGGLISDDVQEVEQRVPILGSIPLLGWLFRYSKTTHDKRNLMVFLRPTILRDSEANNRITFNKYDYMRQLQQDFNARGIAMMPDDQAPVLPERVLAE